MARSRAPSLPVAAASALPLGFLGYIGVGLLGLFVILRHRDFRTVPPLALASCVPLSVLTLVSALLAHGPFRVANLAAALGLVVLYSIGLAGALLVADAVPRLRLASALVGASAVLAVSVLADGWFGWNHPPAGLFDGGSLHNWSAAVLVMTWPIALHLARARSPAWSAAPAIASPIAVGVALSWSGAIGLAAGLVAYILHRRSGISVRAKTLLLVAFFSAAALALVLTRGRMPELGGVLAGRARIAAEGLEVSKSHALLGWGVYDGNITDILVREHVGSYFVDDLALHHFHSLYVETIFQGGVLGFAALATLVAALLVLQTGPLAAATLAGSIGFLTTQAFDYGWNVASILLCFFLVAALGMPVRQKVSECA